MCDRDDDYDERPGNQEVERTFNSMYPNARDKEWEISNGYYVADFRLSGNDTEAWFDQNGKWYMTVTDLAFRELPQPVKNSFNLSEWAVWNIDDCDKIERNGVETVYIIEVETGNNEAHLVFSQSGELIKASGKKQSKPTLTDAVILIGIDDYISKNHPAGTIINIDPDNIKIEVDILDGGRKKEILFDNYGGWISTTSEVFLNEIPTVVTSALMETEYGNYRIDYINHIETPSVSYYIFELETGNKDVELKIDVNGILSIIGPY
ncbi:MAG: PepSY-like domain-containing protein [Rikenellaceae bacterium]|nr:PepSY-like domain-containing protein [Rikenellaceae bacterium]